MGVFLVILAVAFAFVGVDALTNAKTELQTIVAVLAFGFASVLLAGSEIIDCLRRIAREVENRRKEGG